MSSTAKNVEIIGIWLNKHTPLPEVTLSFDDGSELVLTELFFNKHGFKIGDKVTITISDSSNQTKNLEE